MIRYVLILACAAALSACGADGPPTPPDAEPGVSLHGMVKVGVGGSL